jgi:hypothetical protein
MGTSVIEAGLNRVPSLVAIAYSNTPVTHGYVHELPNFNCGEFIENYPQHDLYTCFQSLFDLDKTAYLEKCESSHEILKRQYDINELMDKLLTDIYCIKSECVKYEKIKIPYIFIAQKTLFNLRNILISQFFIWDNFLKGCVKIHTSLTILQILSPVFLGRWLKKRFYRKSISVNIF